MPISKNRIKYIHALEQKKTRREEGVFVAEGPKLTCDLLDSFKCLYLAATAEWMESHPKLQTLEKGRIATSQSVEDSPGCDCHFRTASGRY